MRKAQALRKGSSVVDLDDVSLPLPMKMDKSASRRSLNRSATVPVAMPSRKRDTKAAEKTAGRQGAAL